MNFINLTNKCLYHFFVINNMKICKPTVKFVVSLTSLIKKMNNILKIIYILKVCCIFLLLLVMLRILTIGLQIAMLLITKSDINIH